MIELLSIHATSGMYALHSLPEVVGMAKEMTDHAKRDAASKVPYTLNIWVKLATRVKGD